MRKKALVVYAAVILIGLAYYCLITFTDISPTCFIYEHTGIQCPGCGTTRMFQSMIRLDFTRAFLHNPALFIIMLQWNTIGILCLIDRFEFLKKPKFMYMMLGISVALYVVVGVLRAVFFNGTI